MMEGAKKIPDPITLPTMRVVASRSPRPRTSPPRSGSAAVLAASPMLLASPREDADRAEDSTGGHREGPALCYNPASLEKRAPLPGGLPTPHAGSPLPLHSVDPGPDRPHRRLPEALPQAQGPGSRLQHH